MLHIRTMDIFILFWRGTASNRTQTGRGSRIYQKFLLWMWASSQDPNNTFAVGSLTATWRAPGSEVSQFAATVQAQFECSGERKQWAKHLAHTKHFTGEKKKKKICCARTKSHGKLACRAVIERSMSWPALKETKGDWVRRRTNLHFGSLCLGTGRQTNHKRH